MSLVYYNNSVVSINGVMLNVNLNYDPLNPLNLPPYTIRVKYAPGTSPSSNVTSEKITSATTTLVDSTENIWDVTYENSDWSTLFYAQNGTSRRGDLIEVLGANTTNITDMTRLFYSCRDLTTVSLFDTSNVTSATYLFGDCDVLSAIPFIDISNITDMAGMFNNCRSISSIPYFNTSHITNMNATFNSCSSLTSVPLFDMTNVTSPYGLRNTFEFCSSLTSLPLFNTSAVKNMYGMIKHCTSLKTIPLFNTTNCTDTRYMCFGCTEVESGAYDLYVQMCLQPVVPELHEKTFTNCGSNTQAGQADLDKIGTSWGGNWGGLEPGPVG